MAPPNRARNFGGGGRGGFDLGALLLMGKGMPKENKYFGMDQEEANVTAGRNVDVESPYEKTTALQRYAGNNADQMNAEYRVQQSLAKVELANRLKLIGAEAEAKKLLQSAKFDNDIALLAKQQEGDMALEGVRNTNELGQITAKGKEDRRSARTQGKQTRKNQDNASRNLLVTDTNRSDLERRNTLDKQTGDFMSGQSLSPRMTLKPEQEGMLSNNFDLRQSLVPRNLEAATQQAEGAALKAGMYDIGANGTVDLMSPDRRALLYNKATEPDLLNGTSGRPASVTTQPTRILPKPTTSSNAGYQTSMNPAAAEQPTIMPSNVDNPPAVLTKDGSGGMVTAKPRDEYDDIITGVFNNPMLSHPSYRGASRGELEDTFNAMLGADFGLMPQKIGSSVLNSYPTANMTPEERNLLYQQLNPRQKRQTALTLQNMVKPK